MAKYKVDNHSANAINLPYPVLKAVPRGGSLTVEAEPNDFASAGIARLIGAGVLSVSLVSDPLTSDAFETASLEAVGLSFSATLTTLNATPTALKVFTVPLNSVMVVDAMVGAVQSDASNAGGYRRIATFKNTAGVVTQVGSTTDVATGEDVAGLDVTFGGISGATFTLFATGVAATTYKWAARGAIHTVAAV